MSLLPQRKKSAEEIAKLRESLGIPGQALVEEAPPAPMAEEAPVWAGPVAESALSQGAEMLDLKRLVADTVLEMEAPVVLEAGPLSAPLALTPLPVTPAPVNPRQVRSLKRSERVPLPPHEEPAAAAEAPAASHGKLVRSLRKSEQVPVTPADLHTPPPDTNLPVHRHSDRELNEIRRQAVITMPAPVIPSALVPAHPALIVSGYLFAIVGAVCFYFYHLSIVVTAGCIAAALLVAVILFIKRPLSRHHAAFISVIALFVIVFGALHYFPQIRHGT